MPPATARSSRSWTSSATREPRTWGSFSRPSRSNRTDFRFRILDFGLSPGARALVIQNQKSKIQNCLIFSPAGFTRKGRSLDVLRQRLAPRPDVLHRLALRGLVAGPV